MKRLSPQNVSICRVRAAHRRQDSSTVRCTHPTAASAGFTLVEMLVVILIVGLLAALLLPALQRARITAKNAAITVDIKQLETALQEYKAELGEYPPDFAGIDGTGSATDIAAQAAVTRHIAKVFPRYTGPWRTDLPLSLGLGSITDLTPQRALAIWLGGIPDTDGLLKGFAADPRNPFQNPTACPSRKRSFFEFDPTRMGRVGTAYAYLYWPQGAAGEMLPDTAITYFRAENGNYTTNGLTLAANMGNAKFYSPTGRLRDALVWPAIDTRLSNFTVPRFVPMNSKTFQILCAGLDVRYSRPTPSTLYPPQAPGTIGPYLYPSGENYDVFTQDDITNFSDGTLQNSIP